jgi:multiple sugar transport system substrate-binding protein
MATDTKRNQFTRRGFLKAAAITLGGTAAVSALGACTPQAAAPPEPAKPTSGGPVTTKPGEFDWKKFKGTKLTMALNKHPFADAILLELDQFKEQTGMDASFMMLPEAEYFRKIELDLSTGAGEYDVFMTGPTRNHTWATPGWMEPLDPFVKGPMTHPEYDFGDFFPLLIEANSWDKTVGGGIGKGNLWSIPAASETDTLQYRTDIFEEKGIKPPKTFEELIEAAKKCTYKDKNGNQIYGIIMRGARDGGATGTGFLSMYRSYGNELMDAKMNCVINRPDSVKFYDQYAKLMKECTTPGWTSITWYEVKESFMEGKYAMTIDADHWAPWHDDPKGSKVAGKVAYAPVPNPSLDKAMTRLWTWGLGMSSKSKNKEAAWMMIQWATMKERLINYALKAYSYNATRKSMLNDAKIKAEMEKWGKGTYLSVSLDNLNKYARIVEPPNPERTMMFVRSAQAMHDIWGGKDAKTSLDAAAKEIDEHMTKAGVRKA